MLDIDIGAWPTFEAYLAGAVFSGRPFDYQTGFYVRTIAGLLDGGTITDQENPRSYGPGTLATPGVRGSARGITITGFAYGNTPGTLAALVEQFGGILADERETGALSFRELGRWRHLIVKRGRTFNIARRGRDLIAPYTLALLADDQRIYGDAMESTSWGTSCEVINRGTYPAPVVVEIRGSAAGGYTINGPDGAQVIVSRALASGEPHRYDSDEATLTIGGVAQATGLTRADRLEAKPGVRGFSVSGGAELRVIGNDTYNP